MTPSCFQASFRFLPVYFEEMKFHSSTKITGELGIHFSNEALVHTSIFAIVFNFIKTQVFLAAFFLKNHVIE